MHRAACPALHRSASRVRDRRAPAGSGSQFRAIEDLLDHLESQVLDTSSRVPPPVENPHVVEELSRATVSSMPGVSEHLPPKPDAGAQSDMPLLSQFVSWTKLFSSYAHNCARSSEWRTTHAQWCLYQRTPRHSSKFELHLCRWHKSWLLPGANSRGLRGRSAPLCPVRNT